MVRSVNTQRMIFIESIIENVLNLKVFRLLVRDELTCLTTANFVTARVLDSGMCSISNLVRFSTVFSLFAFAVAASDSHWWYSPCTADPIRHPRNTAGSLVAVRRQLRIFVKELDFSINRLIKLYRNQPTLALGQFKCLRFIAMEKKIWKARKRQRIMLQRFYTFLQQIASLIQVLANQEIKVEAGHFFDNYERKSIYRNITFQMRSLLCEVSDSSISRFKNIVVKNDISRQCTYSDLNIFKKVRQFLKYCQRLFH